MTGFSSMILSAMALAWAQPVPIAKGRPVRSGVDAFPRIATPADEAQRRINRAIDRLDAKVRESARDCIDNGGPRRGDWARQVDVTMHGPEFVSYLVTDDVDCGGAHPNEGHSAIVYDLRSGAPVDWAKLLPPALTGALALRGGEDGVQVVTLASSRLFALYRAGYHRGRPANEDEEDCREAIASQSDDGPVPMLAWLDAAGGGLALQFDLPHVMQNCSEAIVVPLATLRREGAGPRLLAALTAAHADDSRARARASIRKGGKSK